MMRPRTLKIVAIILVILTGVAAILGYESVYERQNIPPAYAPHTLDV